VGLSAWPIGIDESSVNEGFTDPAGLAASLE
jgi:hypothetical protein